MANNDVVYREFKGLRNDVAPERFEKEDLVAGINCDLDKSGRISRRDGFTKQLSGVAHSLWADDTQSVCLFATGNQLKQLNGDYTSTVLSHLAGIGARISYQKTNDNVYFSNGVDIGILQNGVVRTWGIAVPPLPGVALTVGYLPAGTYQFAMTYLRVDGQESGAPLAGEVQVPQGGGIVFSLPVSSDPGVAAKMVYLSTPNGDDLFQALLVSNATTAVTYAGDTLELNTPLETQFLQPPPAGQLVAYYRGVMFVAAGDTLYPSEGLAYEQFDYRNYIQLDGRITLLAPMEDAQGSGFFIGTDRSCGVLIDDAQAGFRYIPKTSYGAILGALDFVDGSVFGDNSLGARPLPMWLTTQGICVGKPDMGITNLTRTKYAFAAAGQGAAVFIAGPNRFIATSNY